MSARIHYCVRCRGYSDVCDLCWGTGKRGRAECRRCRATGAFVRHEDGCTIAALLDKEFSRAQAVQARFADMQDGTGQAVEAL